MAKASDLNVRLGLIFDEKALGQAERSLRRAGDRLTKVGNEMMTGLTLPLGLFGASAIKAAGDLESLTKALQTQSGSAAAASQELQKLTELARNPGLGIEETIRASVRLQSVGIEADKARGIIKELGNAIAASGNGAQEFDGVVKQFAQMISKGRILQEDISVISESLPMISQLMQSAFGTSSVEMLRKNNVSVEEFISKITQAASELPRFESGIKNNISNALDEMRISLGKVGLAIENSFNVSGNLSAFAEWLSGLAATFSSLNPAVQSAILYFGAFLVAIGPIAKTIGNIQLVSSVLTGVWAKLLPKVQDLTKWLGLQRAAFIALTPATQAFVAIGLAVAIGTMAYNMGLFNRELTASEKALAKVNELTQQAKSDTAGERAQVEALIGILKSETESREKKIEALEKLKQINPEYFGQLNIEKLTVDNLNKSYEAYVDGIIKAARAKKAEGELIKLDEAQQQALQRVIDAEKAVQRQVESRSQAQTFASASNQINANQALIDAKSQLDAINKQIEAVKGLIKENVKLEVSTKASSAATLKSAQAGAVSEAATKKQTKEQKALNDELEKTAVIQSKPIPNFEPLPTPQIPGQVQSEVPLEQQIPDFSGILAATADFYKKQQQDQEDLIEARKKAFKDLAWEAAYSLENLFSAFDERQIKSLEASYQQRIKYAGKDTDERARLEAEFEAKREEIQRRGAKRKKALAMAEAAINTAVAITKTYAQFGFPFGLGLAIAQAAVGATQIAAIAATPFARGTQFAPGGLSLVGEQGPELMNVPRGSQILSNNRTNRALEGINSQANISGEFTVRGTDLVLVLDRAQSKQKRVF
jgi:tape measure domain-containing protein